MSRIMDLLLESELPKEETELRIKRLGEDAVVRVRALTFDQVAKCRAKEEDFDVWVCFYGCIDPIFSSGALREKLGVATGIDAIKKVFLPGEIEEISRTIERLSGYRKVTTEEIKKN